MRDFKPRDLFFVALTAIVCGLGGGAVHAFDSTFGSTGQGSGGPAIIVSSTTYAPPPSVEYVGVTAAVGATGGMTLTATATSTGAVPTTRTLTTTSPLTCGGSSSCTLAADRTLALGTVPVTSGGTGLTSCTTGDLNYCSAANTVSALPDVAAGKYLRSGGVSTAPLWSTLVLPNAATSGNVFLATSTDTIGAVALSGDATIAAGGALTLKNSGVTAGSYNFPTVTFDAQGRATSAASGSSLHFDTPFPVLSTSATVTTGDNAFHALTSAIVFPQVTGTTFFIGRLCGQASAIAGKCDTFDVSFGIGLNSTPGSFGTNAAGTSSSTKYIPEMAITGSSTSGNTFTLGTTLGTSVSNFSVLSTVQLQFLFSTTSVTNDTVTVGYNDNGLSNTKLKLVGGYFYIAN